MTDAYFNARDFQSEAREVGRLMRSLPKDVQKAIKAKGKDRIGVPLADAIRSASRQSKWYPKVTSQVKPVAGAAPGVKLTSAKRVFSDGASTRDILPGSVWGGGGTRKKPVARKKKSGGFTHYQRRTTAGFRNPVDFVYRPISDGGAHYLREWTKLMDEAVQEGFDNA